MDALMLDGNAAAGALQEVFAAEMTTAVGTCDSCGTPSEIGGMPLYRSAGLTLRSPSCDAVLMNGHPSVDRPARPPRAGDARPRVRLRWRRMD